MPHILSLPSETLTQIFTHLDPDKLMLFCPSKDPGAHFSTWGTAGHLILPDDPYAASLLVCKPFHDIVMPLVKSSTVAFCSLPRARMGLKKFKRSRGNRRKVVQTCYFTPGEDALWLDQVTYAGLPFEVRAWRWLDRHDNMGIGRLSHHKASSVWRLEFVAGQSDQGAVKRGYRTYSEWHEEVSSVGCEWVEAVDMSA